MRELQYGLGIREAFEWLLEGHPNVFTIGQGLWSPWYVGNSMTDLDVRFGRDRVIDSPISEAAVTGAALGAALCGYRPIVIHPRVDFMLLAVDQIVTQAAKWNSMFGGGIPVPLTVRAIINRGGEQGAQHSQSLQSWFANIPGLRVVMPATAGDARDLLIASVLSDDPVLYMDDRWLYDETEMVREIKPVSLETQGSVVRREGTEVTLVGVGYTTKVCMKAAEELEAEGISAEVIDLRVLNPFDPGPILDSVKRTGRLVVADGGWKTCGVAGEVIASVAEARAVGDREFFFRRVTHPDAPAPTSGPLEKRFYFDETAVVAAARAVLMPK